MKAHRAGRRSSQTSWARSRRFLLAAACAGVGFTATSARADDGAAMGEQLFSEGRRLMAAGKPGEACPKFLASYNLQHGVGSLLNLAECYEQNHQIASAWARFLEARTLATRSDQAERADYATKHAAMLEPRRSMLTIVVDPAPPGLVIKRDGDLIDPAAYGVAVPVDGGTHTIEVTATGRTALSASVTVAPEADHLTYAVPQLVDGAAEVAPSRRLSSTRGIAGLAVAGAGVVGLGVGTAFGAIALSQKSAALDACPGTVCTSASGASKWSTATSSATVSTIGLIAGGVLVAGGAVLWFTAPRPSGTGTQVGFGPMSLQLKGTF
jgi:hypothetical protein